MTRITLLYAAADAGADEFTAALESLEGFSVASARTGEEALDRIDAGGIDVLVYDRYVPNVDGPELLEAARRRDAHLPAILLSDGTGSTDADRPSTEPTAIVRSDEPDATARLVERVREIVRLGRGDERSRPDECARTVLDRITDGFYRLDDEWRFTYLNEAAEETLGRPESELLGRTVWQAFPETTETILYDRYRRAKRTGERAEFEFYFEPLETWFWIAVYPSSDGLSVYFRDVTDQTLRARAIDEAQFGVVITDPNKPDNPITYANEAFERITGYSESEVRGRNCRFLQGIRTRSAPVARMREAIDARQPVEVELINYRKNGTPFWNHVQLTPVFDDDGDLTHFIGFQQDVTARVEEERRVQLLNRILRHNLRNSLNVVMGHASVLEETVPDRVEHVDPIVEHATTLLQIAERARNIDAVLQLEEFEPQALSLDRLVDAAVSGVERSYPDARISTQLPDDGSIIASEALAIAFEELVENGVKHASESPPSVTITAERGNQSVPPEGIDRPVVRATFVDSGPPLTEQETTVLEGIEETPLRHGSGMGLWLVQWIVTMEGGSISVAEHAEGGNAITVTLLDAAGDSM